MTDQELRRRMDIALALGGDVMTFGDLVELHGSGRVQLWFAAQNEGVIATEIINYPRKKVLNCFLAAGTIKGVLAVWPQVEHFAIESGVDALLAAGSPGWGRVGRRFGWRLHSLTFVKNLKGH